MKYVHCTFSNKKLTSIQVTLCCLWKVERSVKKTGFGSVIALHPCTWPCLSASCDEVLSMLNYRNVYHLIVRRWLRVKSYWIMNILFLTQPQMFSRYSHVLSLTTANSYIQQLRPSILSKCSCFCMDAASFVANGSHLLLVLIWYPPATCCVHIREVNWFFFEENTVGKVPTVRLWKREAQTAQQTFCTK